MMHVLVVTRLIGCVEIGYSRFIPFFARRRPNPGLVLRPETPGFPCKKRLPSNTNTIPIPMPR